MRRERSWRIILLALLGVTVALPLIYVAVAPLDLSPSIAEEELVGEISGAAKSFSSRKSTDSLKLNSIEEETGEGRREPVHLVFREGKSGDGASNGSAGSGLGKSGSSRHDGRGRELQMHNMPTHANKKKEDLPHQTTVEQNAHSAIRPVTYEKIRQINDQLIMAKAYLRFAPTKSKSHLMKELQKRIKETERAISRASKDSDLSRVALQRMRALGATLSKAKKAYPDCSAMVSKLRALTYGTEEHLRAQKSQASYLIQLATRTFPKGLHCLSMQLTMDYFNLSPEERQYSNMHKVKNADLYHYAIFSDNLLACAVVVNSTISSSMEPEKIVFHVVTDSLNFPAMKLWFLLNPPGQATIQIENLDDFKWLPSGYSSMFKKPGVRDPRFASPLNHLRFYLPEIYPYLNKVLLLDHDVVVQRDLRGLWSVHMKGRVNAAVKQCQPGDSSHLLESLVDFSDPMIATKFHPKACIWAYGMNLFDLAEWRHLGLTNVYQKLVHVANKQRLWNAGSLPMGQLTFYNHTVFLNRRWHVLGLGYDPDVSRGEIEKAAVIHYEGQMKPWLEIGIPKYRGYWSKFLDYNNPYFQRCNIHE